MRGTFFVREDRFLLNNRVFSGEALYGMKSDNYMYIHLRSVLQSFGITLDTQDILSPSEADFIICLNETSFFKSYKRSEKNKFIFLILSEPPVYNFIDWQIESHLPFDKVFTYNSDFVDNIKYFHYNFPIDFSFGSMNPSSEVDFNNKKHCVIVAGAISIAPQPQHYKSLLYERFRAIKWYNRNAKEDLDFFARTNPIIHCGHFKGASLIKRINPSLHAFISKTKFNNDVAGVFRGAIPAEEKIGFLSRYKYSLCFENTHSIKGLISEKIFDCFMALNVPIYLGAPDISRYIPEDCFIPFEHFKNYHELNKYLHSLSGNAYRAKQEAIIEFINGQKVKPFKLETYTSIFLRHITQINDSSLYHLYSSVQ